MGKRHREDKEKAKMERKKIKELLENAFNHFGKNILYEEQLFAYFIKGGMNREEVNKLIISAIGRNIVTIGVKPIADEEDPLKILGHVTVFRLTGREDE